MTCPLIGHIAVVPVADLGKIHTGPAIRVRGYREHDVIFVNPAFSLWARIEALAECVQTFERPQLVFGVTCHCDPLLSALSA